MNEARDGQNPAAVESAFKKYHEARPNSPLTRDEKEFHWFTFASTKDRNHLKRLVSAILVGRWRRVSRACDR